MPFEKLLSPVTIGNIIGATSDAYEAVWNL